MSAQGWTMLCHAISGVSVCGKLCPSSGPDPVQMWPTSAGSIADSIAVVVKHSPLKMHSDWFPHQTAAHHPTPAVCRNDCDRVNICQMIPAENGRSASIPHLLEKWCIDPPECH